MRLTLVHCLCTLEPRHHTLQVLAIAPNLRCCVDTYVWKEDLTVGVQIWEGSFSDPCVKEYHRRLQMMLLFFIDASSYIDDTDPVWEVLFLFKRVAVRDPTKTHELTLVGYVTLYTFTAFPYKRRLRVSQVSLLRKL